MSRFGKRTFAGMLAGLALLAPGAPPLQGWAWANAVSYTRTRPPFKARRTVKVSSPSRLGAAIRTLRPGDLVLASAFDFNGELTISRKLAAVAVLDLTKVRFKGFPVNASGGQSAPGLVAIYFIGSKNVRVYAGDVTNPGGSSGVDFFDNDHCLFWVRKIHDTGGDGISVVSNAGPITDCDIYVAECVNWFTQIGDDVHAEKGTGGHACQFGDGGYPVTGTRFAMWAHDGPHGTALQYGASGGNITGNTIYLKAERLGEVSTSQRSGNGVNLWGSSPISADFKYLEVDGAQGYAVSVDDEYRADFSTVVFEQTVESGTRENPVWQSEPTFNPGPTYPAG